MKNRSEFELADATANKKIEAVRASLGIWFKNEL
jgi:hypothetical protein